MAINLCSLYICILNLLAALNTRINIWTVIADHPKRRNNLQKMDKCQSHKFVMQGVLNSAACNEKNDYKYLIINYVDPT